MKRKLALLVAALLVCSCALGLSGVFAAGETVTIATAMDLAAAIKNQDDNQTWILTGDMYDLDATCLAEYEDYSNGGNTHWYFPIYKDGITIKGENNPIITSSVTSVNSSINLQNFITVFGDGLTIENVQLKSKTEANKVIEIRGKDFTLRNVDVLDAGEGNGEGGSIYFNSPNVGNSLLENVNLKGRLIESYKGGGAPANIGTITLDNVVVDASESVYMGDDYWLINTTPAQYYPAISTYNGMNPVGPGEAAGGQTNQGALTANNPFVVADGGLTIQIGNGALNPFVQMMQMAPEGTVIELMEDIELGGTLFIYDKAEAITIKGNGHTITASAAYDPDNGDILVKPPAGNNRLNLITVGNCADITFTDVNIVTTGANRHGLNIVDSSVTLNDVVIDHEASISGAPLIINASDVKVTGALELIAGDTSWYGFNVDSKGSEACLDLSDATGFTFTDNSTAKDKEPGTLEGAGANVETNADIIVEDDGTVRMAIRVESVEIQGLDDDGGLALEVGDTKTLTLEITPADADYTNAVWASADTAIATVVDGVVTAVAPGTTTINVTVDGQMDRFTIVVSAAAQELTPTPSDEPIATPTATESAPATAAPTNPPVGVNPPTGDINTLAIVMVLMVAAAALVGGLQLVRRKQN